eukprot:SAG22_NODE_310_length_12645_cov_20.450183_12_plen_261_part_00
MRVVYATAIAAIIGAVAVYEAYRAGEELDGADGADGGGLGMGASAMAKGFCGRLGKAMHPRKVWEILKKRPIILCLLLFLHAEIFFGFHGSAYLLGEERMDAITLSAAPIMALLPAMPSFSGLLMAASGSEASAGSPNVFPGAGCYWEKGRKGAAGGKRVRPHSCSYETEVCCPEGCAGAGGRWIWGEAGPAAQAEAEDGAENQTAGEVGQKAKAEEAEEAEEGAAGGGGGGGGGGGHYEGLTCSKGCASVTCGAPKSDL